MDRDLKMKLFGYCRVSTDVQMFDRNGSSIDFQKEKIKNFCMGNNHELVEIYSDEGISAKNLNRPQLQEMLKQLELKKADGVVIYKLDRITRSVADLAQLIEKYFTKYHLLAICDLVDTRSANGRMSLNIIITVSQWEREIASERTKAVLSNMKKNGKLIGAVPWGYKLAENKKDLIVSEEDLITIYKIKDLRDNDKYTFQEIADYLMAEQYKNKAGNVSWTAAQPRTIYNRFK